eukprot:scaffold17.g494.t1
MPKCFLIYRRAALHLDALGLGARAFSSGVCSSFQQQAAWQFGEQQQRLVSTSAAAPAAEPAAEPGATHDEDASTGAGGSGIFRNFAIIAHVDHGKTTLMDRLLGAAGAAVCGERVMDSNQLEKERGITISSKYTSFAWRGLVYNAVDTPGHADFGGEVERVLGMVDGALLLVDATEGPLSQRCDEVHSALFDVMAHLGASEEQLDFPVLYASAREGWATREPPPEGHAPPDGMAPLLEALAEHVPAPRGSADAPFSMLVVMTERSPFLGKVVTGRVHSGSVGVGDRLKVLGHRGGVAEGFKVTRVMKRSGTSSVELARAAAGDIVSLAGVAAGVADTVAAPEVDAPLPQGQIDPPTLSMVIGPNTSPLAGREGTQLTGTKIGERLQAEAETNVSLRVLPVEGGGGESFEVQARGELQLGLLIENMRREGFELSVSPPRVVLREGEGGQKLEPLEEVVCEVEDAHAGEVIEALTLRRGDLLEMVPLETEGKQRLVFESPSRGLIGFRSQFATLTRGTGLLHRAFARYGPFRGSLDRVRKGALVSVAGGKATTYALGQIEARGTLFVDPATEVYAGMLVGEHSRDGDLEVNASREKKLTNVRAAGADDRTFLAPPRALTLEDAIGYVAADELIEVTPTKLRLRKRTLDSSARRVEQRRAE